MNYRYLWSLRVSTVKSLQVYNSFCTKNRFLNHFWLSITLKTSPPKFKHNDTMWKHMYSVHDSQILIYSRRRISVVHWQQDHTVSYWKWWEEIKNKKFHTGINWITDVCNYKKIKVHMSLHGNVFEMLTTACKIYSVFQSSSGIHWMFVTHLGIACLNVCIISLWYNMA